MITQFKQSSFKGGLNRLDDLTQLGNGEYGLLVNGRVRFGGISTIKLPQPITNLPAGVGTNLQGIYAADKFVIIFIDGRAYFRDFSQTQTNWYPVPDFQLNADVSEIFACIVPASNLNLKRVPTSTADGVVVSNADFTLTVPTTNTPACIVCQDGVSQPFLIFPDGTCRRAKTYTDWSNDVDGDREYVPIGKQMLYSDGILYIIAKDTDGRYTNIFRSVTGRPLDFMVNVNEDGNKAPLEEDGGAATVAYRVDFGEITCISNVGGVAGTPGQTGTSFFVSTNRTAYLVIPNLVNLVFGEPTFSNQFLFSTGAVNNNAVTDILGDAALIDFNGIRSFNAVLQTRIEGRNSPFSAKVQLVMGDIIQDLSAASDFDNYGFFAVETIYGPAILIFDTLLQQWVSVDIYSNVTARIKQFASVKTVFGRFLFFITEDNQVFEFNASTTTAPVSFYAGEFTAGDSGKEQKPDTLIPIFTDVESGGNVTLDVYLDSFKEASFASTIEQDAAIVVDPSQLPFGLRTKDMVKNPSIDIKTVSWGWKVGFWITWNFSAKLLEVRYEADIRSKESSLKSVAADFSRFSQTLRPAA